MKHTRAILQISALLSSVALFPRDAGALSMDFVTVGNAGNAADPLNSASVPGIGTVNTAFGIGTYEVTNSQYAEFLNAVDGSGLNALELFYPAHQSDARRGILLTPAAPAGAKFSIRPGFADLPVVYVTFFSAVRFTNWLHNGQGSGSTETGAYTLLGSAPVPANADTVGRNATAKYWVPSENEWYKAAYYQPVTMGGDADGYWLYPMRTNQQPLSDQPPGATADNTRVGNFFASDNLANGFDDGYALTGSTAFDAAQNYLSSVGAYGQARSFSGTADQGGNVAEWNDTLGAGGYRGLRGGSWSLGEAELRSTGRGFTDAAGAGNVVGFRVATVPEPATLALAIVSGLCIAARRNRRR